MAGAELSDLSLNFEQDGRPQIVTGSLRANWRNELTLDMNIASRWLDLDRITGATEQTGPIESIAKFSARLRDLIPGQGKAAVTLAIDQANLGGDAVGPVQLVMKRSADKLEIQELRVALPGGSRGELQGTIFDSAGQPVVFDGNLALRGTSMARFLTWAANNTLPIEPKADGAFGLRAQITAGNGNVAARDIVGNLSGTTLSGAAQYRWEGRPEVTIALEGPQIDARSFIPAGASLAELCGFSAARSRGEAGRCATAGAGQTRMADGSDRPVAARERGTTSHCRTHLSRRHRRHGAEGRPFASAAAAACG